MAALHTWMTSKANTNEEADFLIHKYILLRGEVYMRTLGGMSPGMVEVAAAFDEIKWVNMMHG